MLPPQFRVGALLLDTSGVLYGLSFLVFALITVPRLRRRQIDPAHLGWMSPLLIALSALCAVYAHALDHGGAAALGYWLYAPFVHPGSSFLGALFGGVSGLLLYCKLRHISVRDFLDAAAPGILVAYAIGRVGCHLAGHTTCCGSPTESWIGVAYPYTLGSDVRVVPTALFEATLAGAGAAVVFRCRRHPFACYLVLHGAERFIIEFLRTNPRHLLGLTQAQWISAGMMVASIAFLVAGPALGRSHHAADRPTGSLREGIPG